MLKFDEYCILINCVSVFNNGKNDNMHIFNFCESRKIDKIEIFFILYLNEINENMLVFKKNLKYVDF